MLRKNGIQFFAPIRHRCCGCCCCCCCCCMSNTFMHINNNNNNNNEEPCRVSKTNGTPPLHLNLKNWPSIFFSFHFFFVGLQILAKKNLFFIIFIIAYFSRRERERDKNWIPKPFNLSKTSISCFHKVLWLPCITFPDCEKELTIFSKTVVKRKISLI